MRLQATIPPASEPIDLNEAKAHLRVEHALDDALILSMIASARDYAEKYTGRQIVAATYVVGYRDFPRCILLPVSPGLAVQSITYVDSGGIRQTLAASGYQVDDVGDVWEIGPAYNTCWPTLRCEPNSVRITVTVGYITPFTAAADVLTWRGLAPTNGRRVRLSNSGGSLPGGLSTGTDYYAIEASGNTCKLSLTEGGAAITLTSAGNGLHFVGLLPDTIRSAILLMLGHFYENREAVITGTIATALPMSVSSLLDMSTDRRVY